MYFNLLEYIKKLENKSINLLFDRTFFTEENYCRLGKKQYSFTEVYTELLEEFSNLDFEIYYITLYLENTEQYNNRLQREGKADIDYAKFGVENSIQQQNEYLRMAEEIKEKYPKIKVENINTDKDIEMVKSDLRKIIEF